MRATTLIVLLGAATAPLAAQGLPPYTSMNPMVTSRTGLGSQPYGSAAGRWHIGVMTDYASAIEYDASLANAFYLLDAELLRFEVTATRNVKKNGFVLLQGSVNGAYAGFLDGFLEWYHNLVGLRVAARDLRPRNSFGYRLDLQDGRRFTYAPSDAYLGDVRLGAGVRRSPHWQTMVSVTLPTNTGPEGYKKGVPSINATTTLTSAFAKRFTYEGTFGAGFTPAHGALSNLEHTTFLMVTQGVRARVTGPFHLYANLIYHSALYHDTGIRGLDGRELTIDTGGFFKFKRGPEWILGVTEDLEPSGPAIDVGFRLGARW